MVRQMAWIRTLRLPLDRIFAWIGTGIAAFGKMRKVMRHSPIEDRIH